MKIRWQRLPDLAFLIFGQRGGKVLQGGRVPSAK